MPVEYNSSQQYSISKNNLAEAIQGISIPEHAPRKEVIDLMKTANGVYTKTFTAYQGRCQRYSSAHESDFLNLKADLVQKFDSILDLKKEIPLSTGIAHAFCDRSVKNDFKKNLTSLKSASISQAVMNSNGWFALDSFNAFFNGLLAFDLTYFLFG